MSQFWLYFTSGLEHILDWNAYDHILFLIVLVASYSFYSWKRVIWLFLIFILSNIISLFLSTYEIVLVDISWLQFLIPFTVLVIGIFNMINAKRKESKNNISILYFLTAFFGIIHGLDFSTYFKRINAGAESTFLPLLEFSLGLATAMILVVFIVLIINFLLQNLLRVKRRDWILVVSAIAVGIVLPILKENYLAL
jgi:hypothetical protein